MPKNVLGFVIQTFVDLEAFDYDATSDWRKNTVRPIRSFVTFRFTKCFRENDKECS